MTSTYPATTATTLRVDWGILRQSKRAGNKQKDQTNAHGWQERHNQHRGDAAGPQAGAERERRFSAKKLYKPSGGKGPKGPKGLASVTSLSLGK